MLHRDELYPQNILNETTWFFTQIKISGYAKRSSLCLVIVRDLCKLIPLKKLLSSDLIWTIHQKYLVVYDSLTTKVWNVHGYT